MSAHATARLQEAARCVDLAARLLTNGDADGALTLMAQAAGCLADARAFVRLAIETAEAAN